MTSLHLGRRTNWSGRTGRRLEIRMKRLFSLVFAFLLILEGISLSQDYIVGEGDLLEVSVYDHPDLTVTVRVGGEGTIQFPLIGQVKVGGLTVNQVAQEIARLLADGYIVDPQVSVFIKEFRSKKVTIMGEVNNPGLYELRGTTTFLELLSKAGGLTDDAGDIATLKRKANGDKVIRIDLKRLIREGEMSQNILIMDGDSIYVTKAGLFYVTGEVKKPDAYRYEEGTTVLKAITMAGGFTDKASTTRVKIIRKSGGREEVIEKVGMDEPVYPDDIIVVPESFF